MEKGTKKRIFCSLFFFAASHLFGIQMLLAAEDAGIQLSVERELADAKLTITPIVESEREAKLRYELTSEKTGRAGRSATSQSSSFAIQEHEAKKLATLVLGIQGDDRYTITIRVFEGDALRAETQVVYPEQSN